MHLTTAILLRWALALLGLALIRDGYAALRGHGLWLERSGFRSIFLREPNRRLGGVLITVVGLTLLAIAWFWRS